MGAWVVIDLKTYKYVGHFAKIEEIPQLQHFSVRWDETVLPDNHMQNMEGWRDND